MVNSRFCFNDDGKLDLYYILKIRDPVIKNNSLVIFIECAEMNQKETDADGLCVSILLRNMGWYLVVIGKLTNHECLIYIFVGKAKMELQSYSIK